MTAIRALAGALCALALCPAVSSAQSRALIVLVPAGAAAPAPAPSPDPLLRAMAARPQLAIGLMSPTQGTYSPEQTLLDVTQGARLSPSGYRPRRLGPLELVAHGSRGSIRGWGAAHRRAVSARGDIVPGRLASSVPGGAGFAGVRGGPGLGAIAAADRGGRVAGLSLGAPGDLTRRTRDLLRRHRLVVAELPPGASSTAYALDDLVARRPAGTLAIVVQTPPAIRQIPLLATAVAAPGSRGRGLTSQTTRTAGVVAGIDLLPTVLGHLGRPVPATVTGRPVRFDSRPSVARLETLRVRYTQPAPRRVRALAALLAGAALVGLILILSRGRAGARRALRLGALAFMWVPALVLVPAALTPSAAAEVAIVAGGAFVLAAATDVGLPWPRGPLAPAAVCLVAYSLDLAAGSHLVELSLLGPNPRSGARFFGIGNELEPALPIVLFGGLAAAFGAAPRSRRMALAFAGLGAGLAVVVGSGYLGADVGGVITVSAGTAVATLAVLPGGVTRRGVLLAACAPFVAVAALALLDLLTGASSHFSRNVLNVAGEGSLWDVVVRRYDFAWQALVRGLMPLVTAGAVIVAAAAIAWRRRLYERVPGPAWRAALLGGLAVGVVGALANDSGPLLFVVAVFALALLSAYVWGNPLAAAVSTPAPGGGAAAAPRLSPPTPVT